MMIEKFNMTRRTAAFWVGLVTWLLGLGTAFSFNIWKKVTVLGQTFFELLDFLTSNLMLPIGGLCMAIFAGWVMSRHVSREELAMKSALNYFIWHALIRFIAPIAVSIVLLHAVGLF